MFKLFKHLARLLAVLSLSTISFSLMANDIFYPQEECCFHPDDYCHHAEEGGPSEDCMSSSRMYVGAFGGGIWADSTKIVQTGTAFFFEEVGGPLAVDARGHSRRNSGGLWGAQIGYEWSPNHMEGTNWNITPAAEVEAYFFRHTRKAELINPTFRMPEHDFVDSFRLNVGVFLINGVISLTNACCSKLSPYVGCGIGVANIFLRKAKSIQIAPPEEGINHFNSNRSYSSWAFAAQAKAGLRYNICERFHIFGEYRFLYLDTSRYVLGSTTYPFHAATSTWNVDVKGNCNNAFVMGIQFDL